MEAMVTKYGGVADRLAGPITRAQALRLKGLAEEAYQPERYATGLSFEEANGCGALPHKPLHRRNLHVRRGRGWTAFEGKCWCVRQSRFRENRRANGLCCFGFGGLCIG
jgi:hypothetical protein